jgi:hypothetical protein
MAGCNLRRFSHRFIDTVLNNYREFHPNTLRVLDNSPVAKDSFNFRLGCSLTIGAKQCEALLLVQGVCAR